VTVTPRNRDLLAEYGSTVADMSDIKFALPDAEVLAKASDLHIIDSTGNNIRFGSLFESEKVVIVFIRLVFFLQDYVLV
jgi:hypothetical protein